MLAPVRETFVILREDLGLYAFSLLGLHFWSGLIDLEANGVVAFPSVNTARLRVCEWNNGSDPDAYTYAPVSTSTRYGFATIEELQRAGLERYIRKLRAPRQ